LCGQIIQFGDDPLKHRCRRNFCLVIQRDLAKLISALKQREHRGDGIRSHVVTRAEVDHELMAIALLSNFHVVEETGIKVSRLSEMRPVPVDVDKEISTDRVPDDVSPNVYAKL